MKEIHFVALEVATSLAGEIVPKYSPSENIIEAAASRVCSGIAPEINRVCFSTIKNSPPLLPHNFKYKLS